MSVTTSLRMSDSSFWSSGFSGGSRIRNYAAAMEMEAENL